MYPYEYEFKHYKVKTHDLGCEFDLVNEKGLFIPVQFKVFGYQNDPVGYFYFAPMPGCCGIVVSYGTYLYERYRGGYTSNDFRELKKELAKKLGYKVMLATTEMAKPAAVGSMMKMGYRIEKVFRNPRTEHDIGIGVLEL